MAGVFVGSFDEFAAPEAGAGADECDEFGCVDRAPAVLGGLDELERHGQSGGPSRSWPYSSPGSRLALRYGAQSARTAPRALPPRLNVDDSPQTAQQFGVLSIPTLILFRGGQEQGRVIGAQGKEYILQTLLGDAAA